MSRKEKIETYASLGIATPASSATSGEAVEPVPHGWEVSHPEPWGALTTEARQQSRIAVKRLSPPFCGKDGIRVWTGQTLEAAMRKAHEALGLPYIAAHPAAAPDSAQQGDKKCARCDGEGMIYVEEAERPCPDCQDLSEYDEHDRLEWLAAQQGEDEPSLPEWINPSGPTARAMYTFARTYHAHMMRKLGDGVSVAAEIAALRPSTPIVYAPVQAAAYRHGYRDAISAAAKLAQARAVGAERAVPEGWKTVPRKADDKQVAEAVYNINRKRNNDAVTPDLVRECYENMLYAAPSPAADKQEKKNG